MGKNLWVENDMRKSALLPPPMKRRCGKIIWDDPVAKDSPCIACFPKFLEDQSENLEIIDAPPPKERKDPFGGQVKAS